MTGDTALPPGAGLGLEPVGQIDRVLEPDASTATHAGTAGTSGARTPLSATSIPFSR